MATPKTTDRPNSPVFTPEQMAAILKRPMPPDEVCDIDAPPIFRRAEAVELWMREIFIEGSSNPRLLPLWNEAHEHLKLARIGVLWTNVVNAKGGKETLGSCEVPRPQGNKWNKTRAITHLCETFGEVPDFLIHLFAPYCYSCSDIQFCALSEHEILHAGQKRDEETGELAFTEDGAPKFCIRPHCVEQFTPIMERYGPTSDEEREFIRAAMRTPVLGAMFGPLGDFDLTCGSCG